MRAIMTRMPLALLTLASSVGLSACGASNSDASEFVAKSTAACIKENGQEHAAYCACSVRLFDEMLNDKDKAFFVTIALNDKVAPEEAPKAAREGGFTSEDMQAMAKRMAALAPRIDKECPK